MSKPWFGCTHESHAVDIAAGKRFEATHVPEIYVTNESDWEGDAWCDEHAPSDSIKLEDAYRRINEKDPGRFS